MSIFCSELKSEDLLYFIVINIRTNYAQASYNTCRAVSYVGFSGYVIKVYPLAVFTFNNALCTKNHSKGIILGECFENRLDSLLRKLFCSLTAKACEDLVGVMMVMIVIVATTRTMLAMFVVMIVIVVVMVVIVAVALFAVVVMLVIVAVTLFAVVVMLVIVAVALFTVVVMVVIMAVALFSVVVMLVIVAVTLFTVVMIVIVAVALFSVVLMLVIVAVTSLVYPTSTGTVDLISFPTSLTAFTFPVQDISEAALISNFWHSWYISAE